jgi:hypothetical protein
VPTALRNTEVVRTISATEMTRFVPPIFPTRGIRKALPAKATIESEVRNDRRNELKWYCSLNIGISGPRIVIPVRIFIAVMNIGRLLVIASRLFTS